MASRSRARGGQRAQSSAAASAGNLTVSAEHSIAPDTETIGEKQEETRGMIAGSLVALLFIIVIGAFITVWAKVLTMDQVKAFLEVMLPPITVLVGSATGFYFGGNKA